MTSLRSYVENIADIIELQIDHFFIGRIKRNSDKIHLSSAFITKDKNSCAGVPINI